MEWDLIVVTNKRLTHNFKNTKLQKLSNTKTLPTLIIFILNWQETQPTISWIAVQLRVSIAPKGLGDDINIPPINYAYDWLTMHMVQTSTPSLTFPYCSQLICGSIVRWRNKNKKKKGYFEFGFFYYSSNTRLKYKILGIGKNIWREVQEKNSATLHIQHCLLLNPISPHP